MDPLEKYQLMLKTIGGKVPECVNILDVSADNYQRARNIMYDRYGDIRIAEDHHADVLFEACKRKDTNTDAKFMAFADIISQSTGAMVNMGHTYEGMSAVVGRMTFSAMPVERRIRFDDAGPPPPGVSRLENLVNSLILERKRIERVSEKQRFSSKPTTDGEKSHYGLWPAEQS